VNDVDDERIKILVIEDNPGDARLLVEMLTEAEWGPFDLEQANRLSRGLERLAVGDIDIILLDLSLPDSHGFDTFVQVQKKVPQVPVIVLSGLDDEAVAIRAVRGGAQDYLVKGQVDGSLLVRAIRYAIERKQAEEALHKYAERLRTLRVIDGAILGAWSPEDIAKAALHDLWGLVPYQQAAVALFDHESREAIVLVTHANGGARAEAEIRLPLGEIEGLEEFEQGKTCVVEDILDLPLRGSKQPTLGSLVVQALCNQAFRSYVATPLMAQGELLGFLSLCADNPSAFTPEHADIAQEVANQIAMALRQARLREQVQRHVVELEHRVAERTADLSAANAELARAVRAKDEFLAVMSHELRTPLNAILGMSEGLQDEVYGPLNERQLKSLSTIAGSGHHLLSLINDILDVSKIEAGKLELAISAVSVDPVCRASLGLIAQAAQRKQLEVSYTFDVAVTTVQADGRRLKQILVNLLSNAVKFTPEGGAIGLEVVGDAEREMVHFTVWDTGIGIPAEQMDRLFKPFVQLDSSLSREHDGTGLGLALVRRLSDMHGGSVAVESKVDQGSRFTVSLPWQRPPEDDLHDGERGPVARQASGTPTPVETDEPLPPLKGTAHLILLAEDHEDNLSTISSYLLAKGYRVTVARNGQEAIEQAREEMPDLILMDIQMPEMNGLEATQHIRADARLADVPIIALTALTMPGDRERCLEAGAHEYLCKPVSLKQLVTFIETLLRESAKAPPPNLLR
jgi:signal transduction histidine kinase